MCIISNDHLLKAEIVPRQTGKNHAVQPGISQGIKVSSQVGVEPNWSVVTDFMDSVTIQGISSQMGPEELHHDVVLRSLAELGIDTANPQILFSFVLGMMQTPEVLWYNHRNDGAPLDEFLSSYSVFRGMLAIIRPLLPTQYFARFFD